MLHRSLPLCKKLLRQRPFSGAHRLYYFHIPKTGGSTVNRFICSQLSDGRFITHLETNDIFVSPDPKHPPESYTFLSGHLKYPYVRSHLDLNNWVTLSTFREPVDQVLSNIRWVRLLGEPKNELRLRRHSEKVQEAARQIKRLDLSKPNHIEKLVELMEKEEFFMFHNCQTRHLCGEPSHQRVMPHHLQMALGNLENLNLVGILEQLDEFIIILSLIFGFTITKEYLHPANKNEYWFGMNAGSAELRHAVRPLIEHDEILYRKARKMFIEIHHGVLAILEERHYSALDTASLERLQALVVK